MGLFYKTTRKEILEIRNNIIKEVGIPTLKKKGFRKSPFPTSWFGRDDSQGYTYYLCRLTGDSLLEDIEIQIVRDDNWIKIILNIFKLHPALDSLNKLKDVDGLQYKLPPNSITEMRLRSDDIIGPPIFRFPYSNGHRLKSFYTKDGLTKNIDKLRRIIENDLNDIDKFVTRWHELHKPLTTSWTELRKTHSI
jgi:hypothetical protein